MGELLRELAYMACLAAVIVYSVKGYVFLLMNTPEEHEEVGLIVAVILLVAFVVSTVTLYTLATRS